MTATDSKLLVGHRLIRRIGSGARAELFLGVPESGGEGVALKVFRPSVTLDGIGNELAALGRSRAPHAVRLDDVASGPDGRPIAILRRLPRASLARLVTEREAIELGEAVTALAPIVSTVAQLHRAGVVHSALGPSSVLFGARGEPVLIGFGHASLIEPGLSIAGLDALPQVVSERMRLGRFVAGGLERARPGDAARALRDLVAWLSDERSFQRFEFLEELEQRLFDLAVPIPISFSPAPVSVTVPARLDRTATVRVTGAADDRSPEQHAHSTRKDLRLAEALEKAVQVSPLALVKAKLRALAGSVRRPLWIGLGVTVSLLALAVSFIPAGNAAHPREVPHTIHPSSGARSESSSMGAAASATSTSTSMPTKLEPETALTSLLARREVCFRDRSVGCLDDVDEEGSPAWVSDSASIQTVQRGGETMHDRDGNTTVTTATASDVRVVERLGDAAIISAGGGSARRDAKSKPALVLLMNTKAGWRIRNFLGSTAVQP